MIETKKPSFSDYSCKNCGENAMRLILLAMMETAGAKVYPSSTHCTEEQKHEFIKLEATKP